MTHSPCRCGREACRELFGFFFAFDRSLTVYEYRHFGKNRLVFWHGNFDNNAGADLTFTANDLPCLPQALRSCHLLTMRITDLDQGARDRIMLVCTNGLNPEIIIFFPRYFACILEDIFLSSTTPQPHHNPSSWVSHMYVTLSFTMSLLQERFHNRSSDNKPRKQGEKAASTLLVFKDPQSITYGEFDDLHEVLSLGITDDSRFASLMRVTWGI
uniref:Post-SET domain-containing protein n=1 Tax=Eptatretus burgeri TaxID=7764 RepID=A0A8C4QNI3_EPTBU